MEQSETSGFYSLVEAEWECLTEHMMKNCLETSQEVEAISQELESLETQVVEAIEAMFVSSEALDFANDQTKRAREMIAKANLLLAQRPITLVLMMINSCSYSTNDLVLI